MPLHHASGLFGFYVFHLGEVPVPHQDGFVIASYKDDIIIFKTVKPYILDCKTFVASTINKKDGNR